MSSIVYWCFVGFACFNAVIGLFVLTASVIKYFTYNEQMNKKK